MLKRGGKQFRPLAQNQSAKLADRRLNDLRAKIGFSKISQDAKLNFEQTAKLWLETNQHATSSGTLKRREMFIKGLARHFKNLPVRNITERNCEHWVKERGTILASETFVHELDVLKAVFDLELNRGLILFNPAKHVKRRKIVSKQIVVPSLHRVKQLLRAIRLSDGKKDNQKKKKDGADWVEFLAYSGARIGEVVDGGDANGKRPLFWSGRRQTKFAGI